LWLLPILAVTLWVYWPVAHAGFLTWDDPEYVTANAHVLKGLSADTFAWALTANVSGNWQPLTLLSHLTDVSLFGLDAGAHHLVSLGFHLINVCLVFFLWRTLTKANGRSAFVAAVFALHPMHVESVAWVSERKDVLSTAWLLVAMLSYVAWTRRPSIARYTAVLIAFALALMSKSMAVTLPAVLLLIDLWPLQRVEWSSPWSRWLGLVKEKIPLFVLAAGTTVIALNTQQRAVASLDAIGLTARAANAIVSLSRYLGDAVWPARLSAFYPRYVIPAEQLIGAGVLLVILTALAWSTRRQRPAILMGWAWFLVTVLPVIGLIQVGEQAMADRYTYVPFIGLAVAVAWSVRSESMARRVPPVAVGGLALVVLAMSAVAARAQVITWSNGVTLWRQATRVSDSALAYENLGAALREAGRYDEALASYTEAVRRGQNSSRKVAAVANAMGLVLAEQGRLPDALAEFSRAVQADATLAAAHLNLANVLAAMGKSDEALTHYEQALALEPDSPDAQVGAGNALVQLGRSTEARPHFERALAASPGLAQAHSGLGAALAMDGDRAGAEAQYREAIRRDPTLPGAHYNLAVLLATSDRVSDAIAELQAALAARPDYAPARELLARLQK
jgi:tetratricopeptide (TPR) repeat protein